MMAVIWHVMMAVWLIGLIGALWWIWPNFEQMALTADLIGGALWFIMGVLAWILAFNYGRQRYWRR